MARKVRIETATVGDSFGTVAVIRDAKSGRKLAETEARPLGFDAAARGDAVSICADRNWQPQGEGLDS